MTNNSKDTQNEAIEADQTVEEKDLVYSSQEVGFETDEYSKEEKKKENKMTRNSRNKQNEAIKDENLGAGLDPIFVVEPIGQQQALVYPSQGLSGTVLNAPEVGFEIGAYSKEDLVYGTIAFIIPAQQNQSQQNPVGVRYIAQSYDTNNTSYYKYENMVLVPQSWKNQLSQIGQSAYATNITPQSQPLFFTVGKLNVVGVVTLQLDVYKLNNGLPIINGNKIYVTIPSATQTIPVFVVNNDPANTPDPTLYIETNYTIQSVLQNVNSINANVFSVQVQNNL